MRLAISDNDSFHVGALQPTVEINRTYDRGNGSVVMPYVEAGFFYQRDGEVGEGGGNQGGIASSAWPLSS